MIISSRNLGYGQILVREAALRVAQLRSLNSAPLHSGSLPADTTMLGPRERTWSRRVCTGLHLQSKLCASLKPMLIMEPSFQDSGICGSVQPTTCASLGPVAGRVDGADLQEHDALGSVSKSCRRIEARAHQHVIGLAGTELPAGLFSTAERHPLRKLRRCTQREPCWQEFKHATGQQPGSVVLTVHGLRPWCSGAAHVTGSPHLKDGSCLSWLWDRGRRFHQCHM